MAEDLAELINAAESAEVLLHMEDDVFNFLEPESPYLSIEKDPFIPKNESLKDAFSRNEGQFMCNVKNCTQVYKRLDHFRRHWCMVHRSKITLFYCAAPGCTKSSTRQEDLRKHFTSQHEGQRIPTEFGHAMRVNKNYLSPGDVRSPYFPSSSMTKFTKSPNDVPPYVPEMVCKNTLQKVNDILTKKRKLMAEEEELFREVIEKGTSNENEKNEMIMLRKENEALKKEREELQSQVKGLREELEKEKAKKRKLSEFLKNMDCD